MSQIRRLSAILLAAAILTGIPYLLLWHLSWPQLPDSWSLASAYLRGWRLPPGVPTALLITVLWALWGLYAAGLAVEALARLRGIHARLRPLGPLQVMAAAAVGTVAVSPAVAFADTVISQDEGGTQDQQGGETDPAPEEEQAPQPVERVRTVSGFGVGSAELTDQMRDDLAPVADMIDSYGDSGTPVRITGHADASGPADLNQELSEQRAEAVADHLGEVLGEGAPEMTVEGAGSEQPRDGGAAAQRRAEVAYTVVPQPPAPVQAEEVSAQSEDSDAATADSEEEMRTAVASADEDGGSVLVVQIPDGAVSGAVGFVGLVGGYFLGKRGGHMPRLALSLPRLLPRGERPALPASPPRPTPGQDIDEKVTVELDNVPGLGITGKGARPAARRLIANALTAPDSETVRVLLTEPDAVLLMGDRGLDTLRERPAEPVRMVGTMEEALAVLQHELHLGAEESRAQPTAPLVLVSTPDPRHEAALAGLLLHGQRRGITAVILGRWPLGGSCVIEQDGLITETSNPLNSVFHCSWPGATADQVIEALRAYDGTPRTAVGAEPVEAGAVTAGSAVTAEAAETAGTAVAVETAGTAGAPEATGIDVAAGKPEAAGADLAAETEATPGAAETAGTLGAAATEEAVISDASAAEPDLNERATEDAEPLEAKRPRFGLRARRAKASSGAVEETSSGFWDADLWETDFWGEGDTDGDTAAAPAVAAAPADPAGATEAETPPSAVARPIVRQEDSPDAESAEGSEGSQDTESTVSTEGSKGTEGSEVAPADAEAEPVPRESDLETAFAGLTGPGEEVAEKEDAAETATATVTASGGEATSAEGDGADPASSEQRAVAAGAAGAANDPLPAEAESSTDGARSTAPPERSRAAARKAEAATWADSGREAAQTTGPAIKASKRAARARAQQARTEAAAAEGAAQGAERTVRRSRTEQPVATRAGTGGSSRAVAAAGRQDAPDGTGDEKAAPAPRAMRYKPKKAGRARTLKPENDS
ncbi:OmpA family protein [Nocardiopsis sp. MG754419]|uniref:OmpA family protein n=1 Tax=Nocardiopsis sp. MG754419 TaxID=2259865 RepID=UPI001BA7FC25|nr:OmpA family protein [Nocardiopsis sp. MG754419]